MTRKSKREIEVELDRIGGAYPDRVESWRAVLHGERTIREHRSAWGGANR